LEKTHGKTGQNRDGSNSRQGSRGLQNAGSRSTTWVRRLFPFLSWIDGYSPVKFRADLIAGITLALVIVPQSMAYAQLAGLPPYYGLYAALVPPVVASLFGSSAHLATGPVAVVSLMTNAALAPLATAGSASYIAYAILLALIVGGFQLLLGVLRLGLVINLLSHPVVNGFTNAAAIVIATSQLPQLLGISVEKEAHHLETVFKVLRLSIHHTHWPTVGLAFLALLLMAGLKWASPKLPNVLIAVSLTSLIAWWTGFEQNRSVPVTQINDAALVRLIHDYNQSVDQVDESMEKRVVMAESIRAGNFSRDEEELIQANAELAKLQVSIQLEQQRSSHLRDRLRAHRIIEVDSDPGDAVYFPLGKDSSELSDDYVVWRLKVGNSKLDMNALRILAGGEVVGEIPQGLPGFTVPEFQVSVVLELLPMAVVISLLGFMEAISIAKRIATSTGQRLDPNQELIGQGLSNIVGAMFRSYPVSGSFSRSAVNFQAGAFTGFSLVFSSMVVLVTLLFLTPLLYYLPLSVLAAVIMMAVFNLINVRGFIHAWNAQKYDGLVSVLTFGITLGYAPHLEYGILTGVVLSTLLYLYRTMRPNWWLLSRSPDGVYRRADQWNLKCCKHVAVLAFNRSIIFANVNHLEESVEQILRNMPGLRHLLIVGYAINELDASGEVSLSIMVSRLRDAGYDISFCGLNDHVLAVMERTGLYEKIGEDHIFATVGQAVEAIHKGGCLNGEAGCPLVNPEGYEAVEAEAATGGSENSGEPSPAGENVIDCRNLSPGSRSASD